MRPWPAGGTAPPYVTARSPPGPSRPAASHERGNGTLPAAPAGVVDEDDLRAALADFELIWRELFPKEQARVIRLLVEEVRYDADRSEVSITFRPAGVRTLAIEARGRR